MARSHWETLCYSCAPDEAALLIQGEASVITTFAPDNDIIAYSGRLLIHTVGFPEDPTIREKGDLILEKLGYTPDDIPAYALQGWVTVTRVKPYTAEKFAQEAELHGCGDDLTLWTAQCNRMGDTLWAIYLKDPAELDYPVVDVVPPEGITEWSFWLPDNPLHIEAWKLALSADVEEEEPPSDLMGLINA